MNLRFHKTALATATCLILGNFLGCSSCEKGAYMGNIQPMPLGTISDEVWKQQESNAEASDFVIHEHEWNGNTTELNHAGMEHVKKVAVRAAHTPFPIIIERSSMSAKEGTKYGYPIHNNEELDLQRREFVVSALHQFGVQDADERVVISPALTPGFQEFEAERAYGIGFGGRGGRGMFGGMGGMGGGGFGFF
jgi:hypothetical protein